MAEAHYPLKVYVCDRCGMVQIPEVTRKETLFSDNYVYFSSFSSSWLNHSKEFASKMIKEYGITNEDLVLEIASNDGYLLQYFKSSGIKVLGVEPAKSVAEVAVSKGIETISAFFGTELALELRAKGISPKVIVANNSLSETSDVGNAAVIPTKFTGAGHVAKIEVISIVLFCNKTPFNLVNNCGAVGVTTFPMLSVVL
jgi:hypothetical protein